LGHQVELGGTYGVKYSFKEIKIQVYGGSMRVDVQVPLDLDVVLACQLPNKSTVCRYKLSYSITN
jgi:hypothetical protein